MWLTSGLKISKIAVRLTRTSKRKIRNAIAFVLGKPLVIACATINASIQTRYDQALIGWALVIFVTQDLVRLI